MMMQLAKIMLAYTLTLITHFDVRLLRMTHLASFLVQHIGQILYVIDVPFGKLQLNCYMTLLADYSLCSQSIVVTMQFEMQIQHIVFQNNMKKFKVLCTW